MKISTPDYRSDILTKHVKRDVSDQGFVCFMGHEARMSFLLDHRDLCREFSDAATRGVGK